MGRVILLISLLLCQLCTPLWAQSQTATEEVIANGAEILRKVNPRALEIKVKACQSSINGITFNSGKDIDMESQAIELLQKVTIGNEQNLSITDLSLAVLAADYLTSGILRNSLNLCDTLATLGATELDHRRKVLAGQAEANSDTTAALILVAIFSLKR